MNALLWTPSPNDARVLELLADGPMPVTHLAERLQKGYATVAQTVQKLKARGYINRRHGSTELLPPAREFVRATRLRARLQVVSPPAAEPVPATVRSVPALPGSSATPPGESSLAPPNQPPDVHHAGRVVEVAPLSGTGREAARVHAEPRGSALPPLQDLIVALQAGQDPLLRAANARLQARVLELEAETAELRRQLVTVRERLAFAASAV